MEVTLFMKFAIKIIYDLSLSDINNNQYCKILVVLNIFVQNL